MVTLLPGLKFVRILLFYFISHIHKKSNYVAYNLTKHAKHVSSISMLMEDVPPPINSILVVNFG